MDCRVRIARGCDCRKNWKYRETTATQVCSFQDMDIRYRLLREGECKGVLQQEPQSAVGKWTREGRRRGGGKEEMGAQASYRQTAVLSLWVHCGGSRLLGWLAPSIRDAWHGSHAPRQLFHPSTETGTFFRPRRPLAFVVLCAPLLVDGVCSCSGSQRSGNSTPFPPARALPLSSYRVPTLADATNLRAHLALRVLRRQSS